MKKAGTGRTGRGRGLGLLALSCVLWSGGCDGPEAARSSRPEATAVEVGPALRPTPAGPKPFERDLQLHGRFREARRHEPKGELLSPEQREEMEKVTSFGYLSGSTRAGQKSGVTVHERPLAMPGYNLATSGHRAEAALMDMDGQTLHRWSLSYEQAAPGSEEAGKHPGTLCWRRAHLLDGGELLAIYEGLRLVKLDRDSRILWNHPYPVHHDLDVAKDGRIYVLTRHEELVPSINETEPVMYDFIVELAPDGTERRRVSLLEAIERSPYAPLLQLTRRKEELFHTNTLEVLDGSLEARLPAFRAGNVLVAMPFINTIAVVDLEAKQVVWALPGLWIFPHQPTVLGNGNLLVFDNQGDHGWSRVVEIDPLTQRFAWVYSGRQHDFFTMTCGTNQRLGNGNTLITESDYGRAFEVTPDQRTVWEYYTPHRAAGNEELIATLFEVLRLPADLPLDWVKTGPAPTAGPR